MRQSVRTNWLQFNEPLEGRLHFMYLDVKGFVRTGVGNLIDATHGALTAPKPAERTASLEMATQLAWLTAHDAAATPDEVAAEWDLVKSRMDLARLGVSAFKSITSLHITDEEVDRFVFAKLEEIERRLKGRAEFADFDSWPADAQLALLSMAWVMGQAFKLPKLQAFVATADWDSAATECRFKPEQGALVKRNDLDQQLFRNAARIVAEQLDPEILLIAGDEPSDASEP